MAAILLKIDNYASEIVVSVLEFRLLLLFDVCQKYVVNTKNIEFY